MYEYYILNFFQEICKICISIYGEILWISTYKSTFMQPVTDKTNRTKPKECQMVIVMSCACWVEIGHFLSHFLSIRTLRAKAVWGNQDRDIQTENTGSDISVKPSAYIWQHYIHVPAQIWRYKLKWATLWLHSFIKLLCKVSIFKPETFYIVAKAVKMLIWLIMLERSTFTLQSQTLAVMRES